MEQRQKIVQTRESILQSAFDTAQIGIWHLDTESNEVTVNDTWAQIIGHSSDELITLTFQQWFKLCHPEDQRLMADSLYAATQAGKKHFTFRIRLKHKDGSWVWTQINGGVSEADSLGYTKALSGTLTDVSELYQSKKDLHYRYEIEQLVSGISSDFVGIQIHETDKVINQALKKVGQFLNIDRCYVFQFRKHNSIMFNTHEWCGSGIQSEMEHLQDLPTSLFAWWMKRLNKLQHIYIKQVKDMPRDAVAEKEVLLQQDITSLLVVPIHFQKNLMGFIGFDSVRKEKEWPEADIHLIKTVAHTIANAFNAKIHQEVLVKAKEKAEESDQIKSAFLATINHELRTPLHHILGFSELLRMNKIPPQEVSSFADKIYKSGKNLLLIIEDILNLALADESYVQVRKEKIGGNDIFMQHKTLLDEMLRSSDKAKNIKLVYKSSPAFSNAQFLVDTSKINQIIVNLLKNAIKFTKSGSIEYQAELTNKKLSFKIKDTGIGIAQHQQQLIFDFFRQADDSSTRAYNGIGVGLAISKRITKILGGDLTVQSIQNEGSTFILSIPIEIVRHAEKAVNSTQNIIR
ncbi:GAF domain-containing sensor histidine kinase [Sunxiuqinia elliptica]